PIEMLSTFVTLRLFDPAGAAADRRPCVPARPIPVTVATSYFSVVRATTGYVAPYPSAIFSPTTNPATLVTGTLVEPAGMVITGPSGSGCHTVVLLAAGVPRLAIECVSALAPVSISIGSPTFIPVVLRT